MAHTTLTNNAMRVMDPFMPGNRFSFCGVPLPETVRYVEVRHDATSFRDVVWWKNHGSEQSHNFPLTDVSDESLNALIVAMRLSA